MTIKSADILSGEGANLHKRSGAPVHEMTMAATQAILSSQKLEPTKRRIAASSRKLVRRVSHGRRADPVRRIKELVNMREMDGSAKSAGHVFSHAIAARIAPEKSIGKRGST
jgi:hypothetical protein